VKKEYIIYSVIVISNTNPSLYHAINLIVKLTSVNTRAYRMTRYSLLVNHPCSTRPPVVCCRDGTYKLVSIT